MTDTDRDYATDEMLAMYLEAGWSDYLFKSLEGKARSNGRKYPNPLQDKAGPDFYKEIAKLADSWAAGCNISPESLCDVGGGAGRTIFEVEKRLPQIERIVLLEPSSRLSKWAQLLLASNDILPKFPAVQAVGSPIWIYPHSRPPPIARANERFRLVNEYFDQYQCDAKFDIVTCLNVVDRIPSPRDLIDKIQDIINVGGILILSSPFDFNDRSTPNTDNWIDDLNSVFVSNNSWHHIGQHELFYEFRFHGRNWTRFCSQVVGKCWRPV